MLSIIIEVFVHSAPTYIEIVDEFSFASNAGCASSWKFEKRSQNEYHEHYDTILGDSSSLDHSLLLLV